MASGKLTDTFLRRASIDAGRYMDGKGLFLNVTAKGSRSWIVRLQKDGKRRDFGLGPYPAVSLSDARAKAQEHREMIAQGLDPKVERQRARETPTFAEAAKLVHAENKSQWRNTKHRAQWLSSLETHAFPILGNMRVNEIDRQHVLDVLKPIWLKIPETARRVRQRILQVLDWATGNNFRDDPFAMRLVNAALPKAKRVVRHHPALPYDDVPAFVARLRESETMARLALELVLLTACRSGEIRLATWREIDFDKETLTIPASRMKANKPHTVPLSAPALRILNRARELKTLGQSYIFAGARHGKPLSDMALLKVMRDMDLEAVPHGLRSTFRDWAAEISDYPADLAEAALAHTIRDKVEAAYRRGALLAKRRRMMADWAAWCEGSDSEQEKNEPGN